MFECHRESLVEKKVGEDDIRDNHCSIKDIKNFDFLVNKPGLESVPQKQAMSHHPIIIKLSSIVTDRVASLVLGLI